MSITAITVLAAIFVPFGLIGAAVIWCGREDAVRARLSTSEPTNPVQGVLSSRRHCTRFVGPQSHLRSYPHLLAATPWRTIFLFNRKPSLKRARWWQQPVGW